MTSDTFFRELQRLLSSIPKMPTQILNSEGTEYGSSIYYCKNVYYGFDVLKTQDSGYIQDSISCVKCFDCDFTSNSELCYECVDAFKCYNCEYMEDCTNTRDSSFSSRCSNCHDVFGCVRLKNKSFCIFNRQLSETDYREKVEKYKKWSVEKVLAEVEKIKGKLPVTQTHEEYNENSSFGNYVYYCKNCYLCFDTLYAENCGYLHDCGAKNENCFDMSLSGESQLAYEVIDSGNIFNSNFVVWSKNCQDSWYLFDCFDVKDSIGCVKLEHKRYCILNRQFTKEDYERIAPPLLAELKAKNLAWGGLIY